MSDHDTTLRIPSSVPLDFAQYLRGMAAGSFALSSIFNSALAATPDDLWRIADGATRDIGNRTQVLSELFKILYSAPGLLPTKTVTDKRNAQRKIATKAGALRAKCQADPYASQADLRDVLAVSARGDNASGAYAASVAALLYKIGAADTGITLPDLLAGLEKAMHESADSLDHPPMDPQKQITSEPRRAMFSDLASRRYQRSLAKTQGVNQPVTIRANDKGHLVAHQQPINMPVCLQVHSRSASFSSVGIDYKMPLYGPFEPVHDADFTKSPPKPQQNHLYVATRLVRWLQTYTGDPHEPLVRKTVDALLGHRDREIDHENYVTHAVRRASS